MKKEILFVVAMCGGMMGCSSNNSGVEMKGESVSVVEKESGGVEKVEEVKDMKNVREAKWEAVDLGLSVLWADRNVGAETDEEYGEFAAWEEAKGMAFADGWRLPTDAEAKELMEKCRWEAEQRPSEIRVYKVVGANGRSIALPTNGMLTDEEHFGFGFYGCYWTGSEDGAEYARAMRFSVMDGNVWGDRMERDDRIGVRMVKGK